MKRQPTPTVIDLDAALAGVAAMNVEQLRNLWRQKRGQEPPAAFSKSCGHNEITAIGRSGCMRLCANQPA
jgi:hypothetical protein